MQPTFAELAKVALRRGRTEQAAAIVQKAREAPPRDALDLRTLADVALVLDDKAAAVAFLAAAIAARAPDAAPAAWYRVLGELASALGMMNEAIHAFRAAAQQSDDADTWRWLGRSLRLAGDLPAAIDACRRAVDSAPSDWQALGDLATVLTEARAFDEAAARFDEASARGGAAPALVVGRANLDRQRGRRAEAISALCLCVSRHPRHVSAHAALALALRDEQRFDDATAMFRRAIALAPDDAALHCGLGRTLLEARRPSEALEVATSYLDRHPGHAGALSVDALSRLALGDERGAKRLLDHERFVVRRRLPVPEGFVDLASFNEALVRATATHSSLYRAPLGHATADGFHSGSLLIDPPEIIQSLARALRSALRDYEDTLPSSPDHPFASRIPSSVHLDVWCVVMKGRGHQVPHIHPNAWLSGVYYPLLPPALRAGDGSQGELVFGEPDRPFPTELEPTITHVRPEEGLLVLFPSYYFHHTLPFEADGMRISVAFDFAPVG